MNSNHNDNKGNVKPAQNPVIERYYLAARISLRSPLSLSGGEDRNTDMDILRNGKGQVFIPGTAFAGAFRSWLDQKKGEDGPFGYSRGEAGRMSPISISDLYFEDESHNIRVSVRDGVELSEKKTVINKYDREILETGASGILRISCLIRQQDKSFDPAGTLKGIFRALSDGEIRIGGNKNRGFGRFDIETIWERSFCSSDLDEWLRFCRSGYDLKKYGKEYKDAEGWMEDTKEEDKHYVKWVVPLHLTGGISIRRYSSKPGKADYEHITCNKVPVIPGNSWNGAIRYGVRNILQQLGCSKSRIEMLTDRWFGYVITEKENEDLPTARESLVVFGESRLEGSVPLPVTRNKINRFDSSTVESALYSEIMYCGGFTELEIMIKKDSSRDYEALAAILELVITDISKGYLPVGGLVSVGRGIFEPAEGWKKGIQPEEELLERGRTMLPYLIRKEG